jgi:hypothetical protein
MMQRPAWRIWTVCSLALLCLSGWFHTTAGQPIPTRSGEQPIWESVWEGIVALHRNAEGETFIEKLETELSSEFRTIQASLMSNITAAARILNSGGVAGERIESHLRVMSLMYTKHFANLTCNLVSALQRVPPGPMSTFEERADEANRLLCHDLQLAEYLRIESHAQIAGIISESFLSSLSLRSGSVSTAKGERLDTPSGSGNEPPDQTEERL